MKKTLLPILILLMVTACSDDTTESENTTNNGSMTTAQVVKDPVWTMKIDGQPDVAGTTFGMTRFGEKRVMIRLGSLEGTAQITIDDIAEGGLGTYAESVSTQFLRIPGAENCGWTSNGTNTPPLEVVITKNLDSAFHATFTFTDMTCSMLEGGGEAPAITGSGEIKKE